MEQQIDPKQLAPIVEDLCRLAQVLYDRSQDWPALNRNSRRILASVEMLKINLGRDSD
ncbi:MAG: hypothetical protein HY912_08445 [Desulfomonile tiedjei]|uniref:Uncharacterized protein n=1 Tax=Desulfomonile tiedjei TaxID=2358 RepID=A0A9D6Z352_9BACT|nr:hypothetical protein [Desulfomonile tiedjei]